MGLLDRFKSNGTGPAPSAAPPPSTAFMRPTDWQATGRQRTEIKSVTFAAALALISFILCVVARSHLTFRLLLCSLDLPGVAYLSGPKGDLGILPIGYQMDSSTQYGIATIFAKAPAANAGLLTSLVIMPIAAAFVGIATSAAIVLHIRAFAGPKLAYSALVFITLGFVLNLAGFIIAMLVFAPSRSVESWASLTRRDFAGSHPQCHYGVANWLSLASLIVLFFARGFFKGALEVERIRRAQELQSPLMLLSGPPSGWSDNSTRKPRQTVYVDQVEDVEDQRPRRQTVFERFSRYSRSGR